MIMVSGDNGDNGDDGDGDSDGIGDGNRRSAIGGRRSWLVSWSWFVVRRSSLVARFDFRSLDARRRSADLDESYLKPEQLKASQFQDPKRSINLVIRKK